MLSFKIFLSYEHSIILVIVIISISHIQEAQDLIDKASSKSRTLIKLSEFGL